ncbi:MAG: hypothetical protein IT370_28850 [Deltaproteobacteria bacterium]|nr:hypothetical protein [Deltaproteobacteria bacterium]
MRRPALLLMLSMMATLLLAAGAAQARKARKPRAPRVLAPTRDQVAPLLAARLGHKATVSKLLGPAGALRWAALYVVRDHKRNTARHGVATVSRAPVTPEGGQGAISIDGTAELPAAATPSELIEPVHWGSAALKDHDGDGKPELLVIYGYNGPMSAGLGDIYHRELALLNLDGAPTLALHLELDERPEALASREVLSKWSFSKPAPGSPPEVTMTSTIGDYDARARARKVRVVKVTYRWDATGDSWLRVAR